MNEQMSSEELERQAERERARLADTAEQLKNRLTPGQLVDEMLDYAKGSGASGMLHNLKGQVRDNPLALAMVGAGMAWLMAGQGYSDRAARSGWPRTDGNSDAGAGLYGDPSAATYGQFGDDDEGSGIGDRLSSATDSAKDAISSATRGIGDAYHSAGERLGSAMGAARSRAQHASHGMSSGAARLGQGARNYADRGGSLVSDLMDREPLILGALGLAVGAAIGAALPSSRLEDEYLGPTRDRLKDGAEAALNDGVEKARDLAGKVVDTAREQADREGLMPGDKPFAEKVASVARAATDEVRKSASGNGSPGTSSDDSRSTVSGDTRSGSTATGSTASAGGRSSFE